jgi:hypothetical protein
MQKAFIAGILSMIAGVCGVLRLGFELFTNYWLNAVHTMSSSSSSGFSQAFIQFFLTISLIWGIIAAIAGILAIVGGIFALKKKMWGWALAGAIAGTVAFFPCGIPAIIFIALGQDDFSAKANPPLPQ